MRKTSGLKPGQKAPRSGQYQQIRPERWARSRSNVALVHESELARNEPDSQVHHLPRAYDDGRAG